MAQAQDNLLPPTAGAPSEGFRPTRTPYARALRAIGRFLDTEGALRVRLAEDDTYITASWLAASGRWEHYAFQKGQGLRDLRRALAPAHRAGSPEPGGSWEDRLRTVGQELDAEQITLVTLTDVRGFDVQGTLNGAAVRRWYSMDEVRHRSAERRKLRGAGRRAPLRAAAELWRRLRNRVRS